MCGYWHAFAEFDRAVVPIAVLAGLMRMFAGRCMTSAALNPDDELGHELVGADDRAGSGRPATFCRNECLVRRDSNFLPIVSSSRGYTL